MMRDGVKTYWASEQWILERALKSKKGATAAKDPEITLIPEHTHICFKYNPANAYAWKEVVETKIVKEVTTPVVSSFQGDQGYYGGKPGSVVTPAVVLSPSLTGHTDPFREEAKTENKNKSVPNKGGTTLARGWFQHNRMDYRKFMDLTYAGCGQCACNLDYTDPDIRWVTELIPVCGNCSKHFYESKVA
jgi:hypothetical protein